MSESASLNFYKQKQLEKTAKHKQAQSKSRMKRDLKQELDIAHDESVAEVFPDNYEQLKKEILDRLPRDNPKRNAMAQATARYLMGDPASKVEMQMGFNYSKIHQIMNIAFPNQKEMEKVLETTLLNNSVLANAVFMSKAHEMSPKDAAVAAGIFAQRFLEMKKDREGTDVPQVSANIIIQLQSTLADLNTIKQIPGKVIENET